jgi:hypothetical protein
MGKYGQEPVFNHFRPFWATNEWLWWPIGYLHGVMSVVGTLGDTKR